MSYLLPPPPRHYPAPATLRLEVEAIFFVEVYLHYIRQGHLGNFISRKEGIYRCWVAKGCKHNARCS